MSVYFEDTPENREKIQELKIAVMMLKSKELEGVFGWDVDFGRLYAEAVPVDDEDWKDKWKENFKPTKITEKLVVKPTWEEYQAADGEIVLQIDPGMAFGTGTHETTSLCLKLMEKYLGEHPEEKKILDHSSGEISTEDADILMDAIREAFNSQDISFYTGTSYRHIMVWKHGHLAKLEPPHDHLTQVIGPFLPEDPVLRGFMERSYEILNNHPAGQRRKSLHR